MSETTTPNIGDLECSIIIPVYNQCRFTRRCLETIEQHTSDVRYEAIVVNDASTDDTEEFLKSLQPPFRVIHNDKNRGFIESVNRAASEAHGKYLLIFNNDTEVHPHWLREMIDLYESDASIGIVGAKLLYPDGTIQHLGVEINSNLVPFHPHRGKPGDDPSFSTVRETAAVTGACLLINKALFNQVGGLESRYHMYFDDVDLCLSVRKLGYRVMVTPHAVVTHYETQSIDKTKAEKISEKSYPIFLQKWSRPLLGDRLLVGVDVRTLQFGASTMRGIGHYVFHSLKSLIECSPHIHFTLYGDPIGNITPEIRTLASYHNCVVRNYQQFHHSVLDIFWLTDPLTPIPELTPQGQLANKPMIPADLGALPLIANAYDLIPLIFEQQYLTGDSDWSDEYKRRLSWLSSNITHFLALSECTRKDYSQYLEIPQDRISVVGGGIAEYFLKSANPELVSEIRTQMKFQGPMILYVGSLDFRKNPDGLLETIQKIGTQYPEDFRLMIVGAAADEEIEKIKQLALHYQVQDKVLMIGYVSPEILRAIQQISACFLFPSLYEGFGLPVLEAMAAGLPVVSSNRSSLIEVAGDAAILCNPDDTDAMAKEAVKLMTDNQYRQKYVELGQERARNYTWELVAKRMQEVLLSISQRGAATSPQVAGEVYSQAKDTSFEQQYQIVQETMVSNPLQLTYEAPLLDISGYAAMARNLVLGLDDLKVNIRAKSMWFSGMYDVHPVKPEAPLSSDTIRLKLDNGEMVEYRTQVDSQTVGRILHLTQKPHQTGAESIYVLHHIPAGEGNDTCRISKQVNPGHGYYICSTMFETNSIPTDWRDALMQMDEVWVPSHFNLETFFRGGIPENRIQVLPLGIDPNRYNPSQVGRYPIPGLRKFNFLSVFQWTKRKGWDVLLRAYLQAFHPDDDVALVIRAYYGKGGIVNAFIDQFLSELKVPRDRTPPIVVINQRIPDAEMPSLYNTCDAFVLPSRGEGWGIPYMEAMTLGKPVIATNWSGNTEFMTSENSFLIDIEGLKEVDQEQVRDCSIYAGQMLCEPSVDGCAQYMRYVFEHPEEARKIGEQARQDILANWTIKHQAYRVTQRLTEIRDHLRLGKNIPTYASSVEQKGSSGNFPPGIRGEKTKGGASYIKRKPLKILFQNRHNALTHPGGDTEVMNRLKTELETLGVQVDFSPELKDVRNYDLIHLFNVTILPASRQFAENILQQGKSYVITSLYEDWPRYLSLSYEIIHAFKKYLDSGQDEQIFQREMNQLRQLPPHAPLNNHYVADNALCHFCCSDTEQKSLTNRFPNLRRSEIVPFAPTLPIIKNDGSAAFRKEFNLPDFILCVGRLESRKNQLMLLKALEFDDIPLVFATGGFTYQQIYEDLCKRYRRKGQTLFLNRLTPELLASAFQAARLHVLPSWYELPGLVSLEAAALGTGVVASAWGALPDYLGDSAYYFSPDNPEEMRQTILKAWENPKGTEAQAAVRHFSWTDSARKTLEIYQEYLETTSIPESTSYDSMWDEARKKIEHGDLYGAITLFESNRNRLQDNPVFLYQLGELYAKTGNTPKAQEIMTQMRALDNQTDTAKRVPPDSHGGTRSIASPSNTSIPEQENLPMVQTMSPSLPKIQQPLHVSLFTLKSNEACFYVRLIAPLEELERQGKIVLDYPVRFEGNTILNPVIPDYTDVAVFQRSFINMDPYKASIDQARASGKVIIYEIDDLLIDVPDWHPQKDMFQWGIPFIKRHLSMADHITVSTERLKSNLMAFNPFITVIPNTIDPRLWRDPDWHRKDKSPIVIGYTGTVTHLGDLQTIIPAIEEIQKRYGDKVVFKFWGICPKELFDRPGVKLEREYIADYPKYASDLTNADFDLMLVPLAPCEFNECKSPMKWLEYSMAGLPGIYQDMTPYKGVVKHGQNGLLASDPTSWVNAIVQLIENQELRKTIAQNAHQEVMEHHTILKSAAAWEKCLKDCLQDAKTTTPPTGIQHVDAGGVDSPQSTPYQQPVCSIVIPAYNMWHLTQKCLESLYETVDIPSEIIVMDNGSTDDTPRELTKMISQKSHHDNLSLRTIRFNDNQGFSHACNEGAKASKGKYLIFLNNDTCPQPGWQQPLIKEINDNPDIAVVGSKLLYPDDTVQHAGIVFSQDKIPFLIYRGFGKGHPAVNQSRDFPAVSAACMCVPRDLFLKLEGFDENYHNGFEDVDFCLKVAQIKAGNDGTDTIRHRIRYCPTSVVVHYEESTPGRKDHDADNMHLFLEKWGNYIQPSDEEYLRADGLAIDWISSSSGRYITLKEKTERLVREAKELEKQGSLSSALQLLDDVVVLDPERDDIFAWMSHLYTTLDQLEKAESCLETAPKTTKTRLALAETRIKRQRIEEAATELMELKNRIEEMLPDEQYLTYLLLGNCLVHQNKLDEAESLFQEAISVNESGERPYLSLGSVNLLRKQFDRAEQNFHQALQRNPHQPKAHFGLGMVLWNRGDKEGGLKKYQETLDQDINHTQALYSLTTAASELNRWDLSAKYLERYVAKNPSQIDFLFSLSGVYYRMGRFNNAQEICQRILRQQPDHESTKELSKKIQQESTR